MRSPGALPRALVTGASVGIGVDGLELHAERARVLFGEGLLFGLHDPLEGGVAGALGVGVASVRLVVLDGLGQHDAQIDRDDGRQRDALLFGAAVDLARFHELTEPDAAFELRSQLPAGRWALSATGESVVPKSKRATASALTH